MTPLLRQLQWLKPQKWIDSNFAVLVFKCVHGSASPYLVGESSHPADSKARCRLRSTSLSIMVVRRTRLTTVGDQSFPAAINDHLVLFIARLAHKHIITAFWSPSLRAYKEI